MFLFELEVPKGLIAVSQSEFTEQSEYDRLIKICLDILFENRLLNQVLCKENGAENTTKNLGGIYPLN